MKQTWQTCHPFCWLHRVYGKQRVWKTMKCVQINAHFFENFSLYVLPISLATNHIVQCWLWAWAGSFENLKPYELKKMGNFFNFFLWSQLTITPTFANEKYLKQAGAELCQAQGKLKRFWPRLDPCLLWLTNMVCICQFGLWI